MATSSYGIDRILQLLLHRYPFLLVDKVLEASDDGRHLVAQKCVSMNEPFFQGHFPGNPVMPGVLLIETMAQACGLMCLSADETVLAKDAGLCDTILMGVEQAKFRRMVVPGDILRIETWLTNRIRNMGKARCAITVDGKPAAECVLSFLLTPRKKA